jgi:hypothetical protein
MIQENRKLQEIEYSLRSKLKNIVVGREKQIEANTVLRYTRK